MIDTLAYAYGKPSASATFKSSAEDFIVTEHLSFELDGIGEHLFLRIEKRGLNTEELVKSLARTLQKLAKTIAYAGLKDRQALTTQWLSVHCPGEDIAGASELHGNGWRVIESSRHLKKLKPSGLLSNQFVVTLRDVSDIDEIESRLKCVQLHGVPNYFGPQRFGNQNQNILKAEALLLDNKPVKDRFLRGIYYSAARSYLFNLILSERVSNHSWNQALSGDAMQLTGSHSIFCIETPDDTIHKRLAEQDISPTAPLWGKGSEYLRLDALALQQRALEHHHAWCIALEKHDLKRMYRAQILHANNLTWKWQDKHVTLSFQLPPGAYATSVLREIANI